MSNNQPTCSLAPHWHLPPLPETAEGSALLEAILIRIPFIWAPVANQSAAAFGPRLQFQAFPTACAYMLFLLRGVYSVITSRDFHLWYHGMGPTVGSFAWIGGDLGV